VGERKWFKGLFWYLDYSNMNKNADWPACAPVAMPEQPAGGGPARNLRKKTFKESQGQRDLQLKKSTKNNSKKHKMKLNI
jgi:hypothetical protein